MKAFFAVAACAVLHPALMALLAPLRQVAAHVLAPGQHGAAAYRRAMLADTGLLDEAFFMYLEDVDLAFRAQLLGWSWASYLPSRVKINAAVYLGTNLKSVSPISSMKRFEAGKLKLRVPTCTHRRGSTRGSSSARRIPLE